MKSSSKAKNKKTSGDTAPEPAEESMSQCVELCQQRKWREALIICRHLQEKAREKNDNETLEGLENARLKIEYSLRRQMTAALVASGREMLKKEFLLDVAE